MIKVTHRNDLDINDVPVHITHYPVGEVGVRLGTENLALLGWGFFDVELIFESASDLITLALVKDALERVAQYSKAVEYHLSIPYFPFGRQDRVTEYGEAFSLKVAADYINSLCFDSVTIADPHSYVTPALIDRCVIDEASVSFDLDNFIKERDITFLVSPDLGANKKTKQLGAIHKLPVIECAKDRDPLTGNLSGFRIINLEEIPEGEGLIVDDICDGGGTFLGLADKFTNTELHLYVTFGCFTQGIEKLESKFKSVGFTYDMRKEK